MTSNRPKHYKKPETEPWQKLLMMKHGNREFQRGVRERFWFQMARVDHLGREHWHPEYKHLDYYEPAYQPAKFRVGSDKFKKSGRLHRVKKVSAPLPEEE